MTIDELAVVVKQGFKKNQTEMAGTVKIMLDAFQSNQEYMDKNFDIVNKNIKEIHKEVQKVNLNIVDVVHKEEFDKLDSRMVDVEEVVKLRLKKA